MQKKRIPGALTMPRAVQSFLKGPFVKQGVKTRLWVNNNTIPYAHSCNTRRRRGFILIVGG